MSCESGSPQGAEQRAPAGVDKALFREGMARLGAAVNIITSDGEGGRVGFTASAVCSVTDTPPSLLVCLNRSASVYAALRANGVLAVNTLAPDHTTLSTLFGGKTPAAERFAAAQWRAGETGAPLLEGAVVSFDCRICEVADVGTHSVLICEIVGVAGLAREEGLIYFNRAYHALSAATAA